VRTWNADAAELGLLHVPLEEGQKGIDVAVLPVELRWVVRRLQRPVREAEERIRKNHPALVALEALPHRIFEISIIWR
jgi:hypothetical protein